MTGYIIGCIGVWFFSDGVYSIALYERWAKDKGVASWKYDHPIRIIRSVLGIVLIVIGARLI